MTNAVVLVIVLAVLVGGPITALVILTLKEWRRSPGRGERAGAPVGVAVAPPTSPAQGPTTEGVTESVTEGVSPATSDEPIADDPLVRGKIAELDGCARLISLSYDDPSHRTTGEFRRKKIARELRAHSEVAAPLLARELPRTAYDDWHRQGCLLDTLVDLGDVHAERALLRTARAHPHLTPAVALALARFTTAPREFVPCLLDLAASNDRWPWLVSNVVHSVTIEALLACGVTESEVIERVQAGLSSRITLANHLALLGELDGGAETARLAAKYSTHPVGEDVRTAALWCLRRTASKNPENESVYTIVVGIHDALWGVKGLDYTLLARFAEVGKGAELIREELERLPVDCADTHREYFDEVLVKALICAGQCSPSERALLATTITELATGPDRTLGQHVRRQVANFPERHARDITEDNRHLVDRILAEIDRPST